MRYRPASISPGANLPVEISLLEEMCERGGVGEDGFFAREAGVAGAAVGISPNAPVGSPHEGQNRADSANSDPH